MKILVGMMEHETNTFSPLPTRLQDFGPGGPFVGHAAYDAYRPSGYSIAGLLESRRVEAKVEIVIAANAAPARAVEQSAFEEVSDTICAAVKRGCDALFLDLHGAMVTEECPSGEGELLTRLRRIAPELPIAVALDFHANLSDGIVRNATTLVGYKTYPHIDMVETGRRAGEFLLAAMAGRIRPTLAWERCPVLASMLRQATAEEPTKGLIEMAKRAEAAGALAVSVFGGFPLADTPNAGISVVAMTDGDEARARRNLPRDRRGCLGAPSRVRREVRTFGDFDHTRKGARGRADPARRPRR